MLMFVTKLAGGDGRRWGALQDTDRKDATRTRYKIRTLSDNLVRLGRIVPLSFTVLITGKNLCSRGLKMNYKWRALVEHDINWRISQEV